MILSIIIPYYKTYELTEQLLKCLELQVNDNVEIIVIDDGCNEKKLDKFKFAKIKHLEKNQGVGHARNVGIKQAKGEYIGFIDSDDTVSNDYIKQLLFTIKRNPADVITIDWQDMTTGKITRRPHNFAPWRAIYKKSFIPEMLEDKKYGMEDIWFTGEIEEKEHTESHTDKVLYFYNSNRENSLMWKKARNL